MPKHISVVIFSIVAMFFAGCILDECNDCCDDCSPVKASTKIQKSANVVLVGVGNGFAGKCSGTGNDISKMKTILKPYAVKTTILKDKQATKKAVIAALEDAVKSNFMVFYFAGHGTHTKATSDKTEIDGQDEYICCFDTVVSDNEIWSIISKSKGRVFLIFDCCHSGTMYRHQPLTFRNAMKRNPRASTSVSGPISMICWSGCPDDKYSWGTSSGAFMTAAIKKCFKSSLTYDELWKKVELDKKTKQYETVQQTKMGKDFGKNKIFQ